MLEVALRLKQHGSPPILSLAPLNSLGGRRLVWWNGGVADRLRGELCTGGALADVTMGVCGLHVRTVPCLSHALGQFAGLCDGA